MFNKNIAKKRITMRFIIDEERKTIFLDMIEKIKADTEELKIWENCIGDEYINLINEAEQQIKNNLPISGEALTAISGYAIRHYE